MASFIPSATRGQSSASSRAYDHQECAYCYESLSSKPTANLFNENNELVCYHSFHAECLQFMISVSVPPVSGAPTYQCLHCQKAFCTFAPAPRIETEPQYWFEYFDTDKDGNLSYQELLDGLKGQLDLDFEKIEADVDTLFKLWDKDSNGVISYEEFIDQQSGVLPYLQHHFPRGLRQEPPNLLDDAEEWFAYWDEDNSNSLDKSEVTRALIKTFRIYNMKQEMIEQIVEKVWPLFDLDGSGVIEREEFAEEDNLGDALTAQIILETHGPQGLRDAAMA